METININKLFDSKNKRFEIPSYQRAYSWEDRQILQFIEDLQTATSHYYLGHFLFEHKNDNTYYIIDGQQRLTTVMIFISCLIQELAKRKANGQSISVNLDDIKDYYLIDDRKGVQRLKTVTDDNNFFFDEIIEPKLNHAQEADTASKKRIRNAKNKFFEAFTNVETTEIERWYTLVENAVITEYIVFDKIKATQIFAFQNDRGKKLSNLEILKAFFMLQIYMSGKDKENIEQSINYLENEISKIYRQVERINLSEDEVLNYYWRVKSGKGYYAEEVVKSVKEIVLKYPADKNKWLKEFISGLSQTFQIVERIEKHPSGYIRDLRDLNNMALSYPFLIKAYSYAADPQKIERLAHLLENITFRYLIRGGRAEIEARLNHYLVNYSETTDLDNHINSIIHQLKANNYWGYWNDNSLWEHLDSDYFYKNRVDNYLLWKYELSLCDENHPLPINVTYSDLIRNESIEHIAPVTPTNGDPVANGYGIYIDDHDKNNGIASGGWLHCLGNLMLIAQSQNSAISNGPFKDKLKSYGEKNLLNQQKEISTFLEDAHNPVWDKNAIERRHKAILTFAMRHWSVESI